jgi:tripartite-type tricarboxylate transporter receptor subunit TctC
VPAITEAGVKGFDLSIWFGIYAPKGTPKVVIDKLSASLAKAVQDPDVKARLDKMGTSPVSPDLAVPAKLAEHLQKEINTLGPLLKKAGVEAN